MAWADHYTEQACLAARVGEDSRAEWFRDAAAQSRPIAEMVGSARAGERITIDFELGLAARTVDQ